MNRNPPASARRSLSRSFPRLFRWYCTGADLMRRFLPAGTDRLVEAPAPLVGSVILPDGTARSIAPSPDVAVAPALPSTLIVDPGTYAVETTVFPLVAPGLYRFHRLPTLSEQRLVPAADLRSNLRLAAFLFRYGFEGFLDVDEERCLSLVRRQPLVASCGDLARLTRHLLERLGFEARRVEVMTLDPWNGQDDGHTMLEVRDPAEDRWLVYDPSFGFFVRSAGRALDLLAAVEAVRSGKMGLDRFHDGRGPAPFRHSGHDYAFWVEDRFLDERALLGWIRRVFQVPIVQAPDGTCRYPVDGVSARDRERLASRGFRAVPRTEFLAEFYS